jgi:hypothetical protein
LADHPRTVYLAEEIFLEPLNKWLCQVFARKSMDRTVAALVASQGCETKRLDVVTAKKRLTDAEEIRAAASAELKGVRAPNLITEAQAQARLDMLDDVTEVISEGKSERLARLFDQLGVALRYEKQKRPSTRRPLLLDQLQCPRGDLNPYALSGTSTSS